MVFTQPKLFKSFLLNSCILAYSRNFLSGACFAPYEALFLVLKSFLINTLFNLQGTHPRAAQGLYITTLAAVCQEVFSTFLKLSLVSSPSPERLINIPRTPPFVNTFFYLFSTFLFPLHTRINTYIIYSVFDRHQALRSQDIEAAAAAARIPFYSDLCPMAAHL